MPHAACRMPHAASLFLHATLSFIPFTTGVYEWGKMYAANWLLGCLDPLFIHGHKLRGPNMLTKPKPRVKFSPECELLVFIPTATDINPSDSIHTIEIEGFATDDETDDSSIQTQVSPITVEHYRLGDTLRSNKDMEQFTALEDTIQSIYTLQLSEFAWIKRNNGDWTFCQLVERTTNDLGEDVMTFAVSEMGHRKSLRPMRWIKMVRKCSPHVRSEYFRRVIVSIK